MGMRTVTGIDRFLRDAKNRKLWSAMIAQTLKRHGTQEKEIIKITINFVFYMVPIKGHYRT